MKTSETNLNFYLFIYLFLHIIFIDYLGILYHVSITSTSQSSQVFLTTLVISPYPTPRPPNKKEKWKKIPICFAHIITAAK